MMQFHPRSSRPHNRRASAIVLVLAGLVLMALLGAVYLQATRTQQFTSEESSPNHPPHIRHEIVEDLKLVLENDLHNQFRGGALYDYPWTNTDNIGDNEFIGTAFDGSDLFAYGGMLDNQWLASPMPVYDPDVDEFYWPQITNLYGHYLPYSEFNNTFLNIGGSDNTPQEDVVNHNADAQSNTRLYFDLDSLTDATGDGIPDSRWTWAPIPARELEGYRYMMAVRIEDLSAKINLNSHSSLVDINGSYDSGSDRPRWNGPWELDLGRFIYALREDIHPVDLPSPYADALVDIMQSEMQQNRHDRFALPGVNDYRIAIGGNSDQRRGFYEEQGGYHTQQLHNQGFYGLDSEYELRYRGGLNSSGRWSPVIDDQIGMPTLLRNPELSDPSSPFYDNWDDDAYTYFLDPLDYYTYNARHHLTTLSGSALYRMPNPYDGAADWEPDVNFSLRQQPLPDNDVHAFRTMTRAIWQVFADEAEFPQNTYVDDYVMGPGIHPDSVLPGGYVNSAAVPGSNYSDAYRTAQFAVQFGMAYEAFVNDHDDTYGRRMPHFHPFDSDDVDPSLDIPMPDSLIETLQNEGGINHPGYFGHRRLPYLGEVYVQMSYRASVEESPNNVELPDDVPGDPTGPPEWVEVDWDDDTDSKPGYAIEIRNPYDEDVYLRDVYLVLVEENGGARYDVIDHDDVAEEHFVGELASLLWASPMQAPYDTDDDWVNERDAWNDSWRREGQTPEGFNPVLGASQTIVFYHNTRGTAPRDADGDRLYREADGAPSSGGVMRAGSPNPSFPILLPSDSTQRNAVEQWHNTLYGGRPAGTDWAEATDDDHYPKWPVDDASEDASLAWGPSSTFTDDDPRSQARSWLSNNFSERNYIRVELRGRRPAYGNEEEGGVGTHQTILPWSYHRAPGIIPTTNFNFTLRYEDEDDGVDSNLHPEDGDLGYWQEGSVGDGRWFNAALTTYSDFGNNAKGPWDSYQDRNRSSRVFALGHGFSSHPKRYGPSGVVSDGDNGPLNVLNEMHSIGSGAARVRFHRRYKPQMRDTSMNFAGELGQVAVLAPRVLPGDDHVSTLAEVWEYLEDEPNGWSHSELGYNSSDDWDGDHLRFFTLNFNPAIPNDLSNPNYYSGSGSFAWPAVDEAISGTDPDALAGLNYNISHAAVLLDRYRSFSPEQPVAQGMLNVNTAPPHVLERSLPIADPELRKWIVNRIIEYRDLPDLDLPSLSGAGRRQAIRAERARLLNASEHIDIDPNDDDAILVLRGEPGIAHMSELYLLLQPVLTEDPANFYEAVDTNGDPLNISGNYHNNLPVEFIQRNGTGIRAGSGHLRRDDHNRRWDELMVASWLQQVLNTRSDYFVAYVKYRGYQPTDAETDDWQYLPEDIALTERFVVVLRRTAGGSVEVVGYLGEDSHAVR